MGFPDGRCIIDGDGTGAKYGQSTEDKPLRQRGPSPLNRLFDDVGPDDEMPMEKRNLPLRTHF